MRYGYQLVERLPKVLDGGVVYYSEEFEVAALLCACGCGHRVTLLVPDGHQIRCKDGEVTVWPSIAVCDAPCVSHFYITGGAVEWMSAFSPAVAASVMQAQIARHAARDTRPKTWISQVRRGIGTVITTVQSWGSSIGDIADWAFRTLASKVGNRSKRIDKD